jgi:hypothetical protein
MDEDITTEKVGSSSVGMEQNNQQEGVVTRSYEIVPPTPRQLPDEFPV